MQDAFSQKAPRGASAETSASIQLDELLTEQSAAEKLHLSVKTLQAWRVRGFGPAFVRLGRRVLYRTSSLQQFVEANTFTSTSEAEITLADLHLAVRNVQGLGKTRRRDLLSAIVRIGTITGRELIQIPLHPDHLKKRLEQGSPGTESLSGKSLQNLRSDLGATIAVSGLAKLLRTAKLALLPEWKAPLAYKESRGSHGSVALRAVLLRTRHSTIGCRGRGFRALPWGARSRIAGA